MPKYKVSYDCKNGSASSSNSIEVIAETEAVAILIAKDQLRLKKPEYEIFFKKVEIKS
jgi:hypothetical protein